MYRDHRYQEAKDRVKISHFTEKGFDITGIMHVGTNDGYEFQWYRQMGIEYFIGFEPLSSAIEAFQKNYPTLATGKEFFFPFGLSNELSYETLHITAGDGQGSSILDEVEEFAQNTVIGEERIYLMPFARIVSDLEPTLLMHKMDCLVIDVQGYELKALEGMIPYLLDFKYLNIECSRVPVYKGGPSAEQIIDFLEKQGFLQDSPIEDHNDIMFIKKGL